jgi:hypothetical protein
MYDKDRVWPEYLLADIVLRSFARVFLVDDSNAARFVGCRS